MTDCSTSSITSFQGIGTINIPIDIASGFIDYTFQKSYLVPDVDDSICQTFCSVTQVSTANRPTWCGNLGQNCVCSGDVIYYAKYSDNNPNWQPNGYGYDLMVADPSGTTFCQISSFNRLELEHWWDCYCQKPNSELAVYNEVEQFTGGGATFTLRVDARTIQTNIVEIHCHQGTGADYRWVNTDRFNVEVDCGNVVNIDDKGGHVTLKEVDNHADCWMRIYGSQIETTTSSCPISGMMAYYSTTDTGPNPAVKVSPSSWNSGDNFRYVPAHDDWFFDGFSTNADGSIRNKYMDAKFYVQVEQNTGATYWIGGDATPTQFNLFCHPCQSSTISTTPIEIVVDKHSSSGVADQYEISNDFYTLTNSHFTSSPSVTSPLTITCDVPQFGGDPLLGIAKACFCADQTTKCADQGGSCLCSSGDTIYYGAVLGGSLDTSQNYGQTSFSNGVADCDTMYFYPFQDLALTIPWTDSDIVLSTAEAIDTVNKLLTVQSTLSDQTLTVKTDLPFKKQVFVKGLNSGRQFAALEMNIIVCGNEAVTQDAGDFIKVDFQKYRAAGYNSSPAPYFAQLTTLNMNFFRENVELSSTPWFYKSSDAFVNVNSHLDCYNSKTYKLCTTISGFDCGQSWNTPEQLKKVELVGNDLQINLIPFEEVELFILIQYHKGQISAHRKLKVAVCGLETVRWSYQTQLEDEHGDQKILAKLSYQYEVNTTLPGQSSTTIVIDSSSLPETSLGQNITNLYFNSSSPQKCPIYNCDIVTFVNISEEGNITSFEANNRSSQLSVLHYQISQDRNGFQMNLDTSLPFQWETFWIRCFTQSTWDEPESNAFLQVDLQVIDCQQETITILNEREPLNLTLFQNQSIPVNITVAEKFQSSNELFCPIIEYRVAKILDGNNRKVSQTWFTSILMGDSLDENEAIYWKNLLVTDTSAKVDFKVFIEASNGKATSSLSSHLINLVIEEQANEAPVFFEEPSPEIVVDLNELGNSTLFSLTMPEVYDENPWDELKVEIFTDKSLKPLVSFDMELGELQIQDVTDDLIGEYEFNIILSDDKQAVTEYELTLIIVRPELFQGVVIEEFVPEQEEEVEEQVAFVKSKVPVTARIKSIDQVGNMTIKFSQTMATSNVNLTKIQESIEIELSPFLIDDDFDESLLSFNWHVKSFAGNRLEVKLQFDNPLYISMYLIQDYIIVKFVNQTSFMSEEFNYLGESSRSIVSQIPKQMFDTITTRNFKIAAEQLDLVLNTIFWVVLVFNLLFQNTKSMEHYVLMINSLQIAMHVPLFSTALPGNVILYLQKTIPIVMFDIIKEDWFINPTNHFLFDEENNQLRTEDPRFPAQIADIGYNTHNFLENVGSVYIFFSIYILRVAIVGLLWAWIKIFGFGHKVYNHQKQQVVYKDLICLFVEGYLEFCLAGYLQWTNLEVDKNKYYGERLSSEIGNVSIFVACVFLPGIFVYVMTRPIEFLREPSFSSKYGELYFGMKIESKWTVSYFLVFIIRRLLFLAVAFYAYSKPAQQIQCLCLQNLVFSAYVGIIDPRTDKHLHFQELCNEIVIQLCSTFLCLFVGDFIQDQDLKYLYGFILVLVISVMVVVNLLLVFYKASRLVRLLVERYWHRLGRCLDPNYLKPIPKPPKPEVVEELKLQERDELICQLQDLVGEDELEGFTYDQKDQIIRDQVLEEFCLKYGIQLNESSQKRVSKDFKKQIWQLVQVKKKEVGNEILARKKQLHNLLQKNLEQWTTEDSLFWLEYGLKLPQYAKNFRKIPLTGFMIMNRSEQRLREDLSIRDKDHWQTIIDGINQIKYDQENPIKRAKKPPCIEIKDPSQFDKERTEIYKNLHKQKKKQNKLRSLTLMNNQDLTLILEEDEVETDDEYAKQRSRYESKQKQMMNLLKVQSEVKQYQRTQRGLQKLDFRKRQFRF